MSDPVHVIAVIDDESLHEALYVGGKLKAQDATLYMCDVAEVSKGLTIQFSHVVVVLPEGVEYPEKFEELVKYMPVEAAE